MQIRRYIQSLCKQLIYIQGRSALVTFVTAGYPNLEDTVGILKAMQEGGTDIIELGNLKSTGA
jgi:tryptophan synthase alpha subunit